MNMYQSDAIMSPTDRLYKIVLWIQGCYFLITGVWPLIDVQSFQFVTGRKTDHLVTGREGDHWLVLCVGALVTALAVGFLFAAWKGRPATEVVVFAIASAAALAAIDSIYVMRGAIAPIYLVDAALEASFIGLWTVYFYR